MPCFMELDFTDPSTPSQDVCSIGRIAANLLKQLHMKDKDLVRNISSIIKCQPATAKKIFTHNIYGWTFAHACVLRGRKELIQNILSSGVNVNCQLGESHDGLPGRCTLLHLAAYRGDLQIVQLLLSQNADITAEDSFGDKPLAYAQLYKHYKVVQCLEKASQRGKSTGGGQKRFKFLSQFSNKLNNIRRE